MPGREFLPNPVTIIYVFKILNVLRAVDRFKVSFVGDVINDFLRVAAELTEDGGGCTGDGDW